MERLNFSKWKRHERKISVFVIDLIFNTNNDHSLPNTKQALIVAGVVMSKFTKTTKSLETPLPVVKLVAPTNYYKNANAIPIGDFMPAALC